MNVVRHLVFHGRVQGVGFRAFVEDTAAGLSLKGWVRNRRDGTVEAVLDGTRGQGERRDGGVQEWAAWGAV